MSCGNGYDLADAFDGARFEGDMANAGRFQSLNNFRGLFRTGNPSRDAKTFDRDALALHVLPERELERKLAGVNVEGVEGKTDARRNLWENFGDFSTQSRGVVVPTTSELDVIACAKSGTDEASFDCSRSHTCNHERGLSNETGEGGIDLQATIARERISENNGNTSKDSRSLDETRSERLAPASFIADTGNTIEFSCTLAPLADDDGPDTAAIHVAGGQRADAAQATRTEVDDMGSSLGEGSRSRPTNRLSEDLVAERLGK